MWMYNFPPEFWSVITSSLKFHSIFWYIAKFVLTGVNFVLTIGQFKLTIGPYWIPRVFQTYEYLQSVVSGRTGTWSMNSNGIFLLVAVVLTAVSNCLPPSAIVKPKRVYNMTDECAQRLGCCCGSCMVCCSPLLCACFILSPCIGKCTFKYEDGSECSCGGGYWCQQLTLKSWKLCQFGARKSWEFCKWCYEHCDKCCGRGVNVQHRNGNSPYPCEASPLCDKLAKSLPGTVCICAYIMYLYLHVCTISLSLSLSLSIYICVYVYGSPKRPYM